MSRGADGEPAVNQDRAAVVLVAALLALSLVQPLYPREQILQHLPTVPALAALYRIAGRCVFSSLGLRMLLAFLVLHIIGARYIYSYVPYDRVTDALLGRSLSDLLDLHRNHYDRFVHLAFGVLVLLPLAEFGARFGGMKRNWAVCFAVAAVLGFSALYESFEWGLTMVLSPGQAENYNGQQGDPWDAQKDMALASLGAALAAWPVSRAKSLRPTEAGGASLEPPSSS
ncbi:MAG: DUF2238 domain-containing protein [Acidobacteria bacterium]|nr:MAG: DUF2238 domain-containing protein [Acidobacteriota bacterium]REK06273.1 MAG: DUF2238 domain-containing protein [Acidobacteriota bacterium]